MEIMETLEKTEKLLCKTIDEVVQHGDLTSTYLDYLGKATDALKDIYSIKEKSGGGSYERYNAESYSRGRRRDSMGRYMDDGYSRDYGADYSNYGHGDDEEKEFLKWKMQKATTEQEREKIRRKLENM